MKELHIKLSEPQEGKYQAEIIPPPDGADGFALPINPVCALVLPSSQPPYDDLALSDFQSYLLNLRQQEANRLEVIGAYLYDFLFGPPKTRNILYDYWKKCFNESSVAEGMRTVLQLVDSPTLVSLPWELCNEEGDYLSVFMNPRPHTLVRTAWRAVGINNKLPVPLPNANALEPLRVLLAISHSSIDFSQGSDGTLGTDADSIKGPDEALGVDAALFKLLPWMVDLHIMMYPTLDEIQARCQEWEPHVLHFVGHGGVTNNEPYLQVYRRGQSDTTQLTRNAMINLFKDKVPRLVILNACRSGQVGAINEDQDTAEMREGAASATRSFSERLIQKGVLAVIAMQADIKGEDAVKLMCALYGELAKGESIDQALTTARKQSFSAAGWDPNNKWDWALPALYLAQGVRAEEVLHLNGNATESLIFLDVVPEKHGIPLSIGVKIHVGREKEQLTLKNAVLAPDLSTIPPIMLLHGIPEIGTSTMLYWLAECCARRSRPFIYADFLHKPLDYWDVLRLIRDGRLKTRANGVKLHNQLNSEVAFNQFNYILNRKFITNYAADHPQEPNTADAVKDEAPESNLIADLGKKGTVQSDENLLQTITDAFWRGLTQVAGQNGLIIFLDHIEKLSLETVAFMQKYLLDRLLPQDNYTASSNIRFVLAVRDPDRYAKQSELDKSWHFLFERAKDSAKVLELKLEKLPHEQLHWLAQVWARRFFISYGGSNLVKTILENSLVNNRLRPQDVDAYVNRQVHGYVQPVAPGRLIEDLLNRDDIIDWLQMLESGAQR